MNIRIYENKIVIFFLVISSSLFAQPNEEIIPISSELQGLKMLELDSICDLMSFSRKEIYLDSLQSVGVIIRKKVSKNIRGCTLEDREEMFRKPEEEMIIFIDR